MAKYRLVDPSTGRIGGWISRGRGFSEEIRPADILAIDLLERVDAFPSNVFPRFFPNPFENVDHGSRRAHDDRSIHFSRGEKFLLLRSKERGKKIQLSSKKIARSNSREDRVTWTILLLPRSL